METEGRKWTRVGKFFDSSSLTNLENQPVESISLERVRESDKYLPIVFLKEKNNGEQCSQPDLSISRNQIYISLWEEVGLSLKSYFLKSSLPGTDDREKDSIEQLSWLNARHTVEALTEIGAFCISTRKPPHLGSKSKNERNTDYKRDETQKELERLLQELAKANTKEDKAISVWESIDIPCSDLIKRFLPGFENDLNYLVKAFPDLTIDEAINFLIDDENTPNNAIRSPLLEQIWGLTKRDESLIANAVYGIDSTLRCLFSDKEIPLEVDNNKEARKQRHLYSTNASEKESIKHPDLRDLIKAFLKDLRDIIHPYELARDYRKLMKTYRDHRNKFSFYDFTGNDYQPRKR